MAQDAKVIWRGLNFRCDLFDLLSDRLKIQQRTFRASYYAIFEINV